MLIGGAGFLGINSAESLISAGFNVVIVDRDCSRLKTLTSLAGVGGVFNCDILDVDEILRLVTEFDIECVINFISTLIPSSTFESFYLELSKSVSPTFRLTQDLARRKIKYVYISSGGTVYGRNQNTYISESEECRPINFYGYSKLLFEEYLGLVHRMDQLDYLVIRPSNPYGPYQNPTRMQGVISVFMHKVLKDEAIDVWGDGSVVRDYIWVKDMANALTALLKKGVWNKSFNIGSGVGNSLIDLIKAIELVTSKKAQIIYKEARSIDAERIVLDVSKLKNEIDFYPVSLNEGVKLYYEKLIHEFI